MTSYSYVNVNKADRKRLVEFSDIFAFWWTFSYSQNLELLKKDKNG